MAEEKTSPQPDSAGNAEKVLDRILQLSAELNQIRKKQNWFNVIGVLAILVILGVFIANLINFGKRFDTAAFTGTLATEATTLLNDENIVLIQKDFNTVFLPELQKQFQQQLNAQLPAFREAVKNEARATVKTVTVGIPEMAKKELEPQLREMLGRIFQKNGNQTLSEADCEKAINALQDKLLSAVAEALEKDMAQAQEALTALNDTLQNYKGIPEYQEVMRLNSEQAQVRLLESFLEIWIYSLNPVRGEAHVSTNGGI